MNETPSEPCVVICMKWGTLYGPDYVNVLYRAVADNLSIPFRFVCLTDDDSGLLPEVEAFAIPEIPVGEAGYAFGGWPKLCVFAKDLYGLTGRCLFVDLDTVIVGDITPMVQMEGGVCVIREWRRLIDYFRPWGKNGMTSIFAFTLGEQTQILDKFVEDPKYAYDNYRSEQRWVTDYAKDMRFWRPGWVVSFKRTLMAAPILNWFIKPRAPKADSIIVAFHGDPRPAHVVPDRNQSWGKPLRYGRGAVPFVRDYWLKYGGSDPT